MPSVLVFALLSAAVLLGAMLWVLARGLDYLHSHPELIRGGAPLAYRRCHATLAEIVTRYRQLETAGPPAAALTWHSRQGRRYTMDSNGVEEQRRTDRPAYRLPWSSIGGVGLRMQPGTPGAGLERDAAQPTPGYTFHLLIVPVSGRTIEILLPTDGDAAALDFAAHTLAQAHRLGKRINTFGFDRPPVPVRPRDAER